MADQRREHRKPSFPPPDLSVYAADDSSHPSRVGLEATGEFVVGRDPACDVVLDDAAVSRRHITLFAHAGCLRMVAFRGARPAYVNGKPRAERYLASGDIIRLGDTLLSVNYPDLTGDETTEPKAKRGLSRPLLKHGALAQAVLALAERHGSSLGGLRREVLDEELAQLLGLSAVRARHLLDEAYRSELKVGRGGEHGSARYVALAVRLVGGEQLLSARNQPHNLG